MKRKNLLILLGVIVSLAALIGPTQVAAAAPSILSDAEIAGLRFMMEEEKMARDVYLTLYDRWGADVFSRIARSEARHMSSIKVLLTRYDIVDPTSGNGIGEFTDPGLQTLYDQLIIEGNQSLDAALQVGVLIEETDIADLQGYLAATSADDIRRAYNSLLNGSYNHLRAFNSALGQASTGNAMTLEAAGSMSRSGRSGRNGRGGRR